MDIYNLCPSIGKGYSERGASMGRDEWRGEPEGEVTLYKLPIDSGGYDPGAAYWGSPDNLYYAVDEGGKFRYFVRAASMEEAEAEIRRRSRYGGPITRDKLLTMIGGYVTCLLFAEGDEGAFGDDGSFRDNGYSIASLSKAALARCHDDCRKFLIWVENILPEDTDYARLGELFWYARQGHGICFGDDGDFEHADKLEIVARGFGELYPSLVGEEIEF